MDHGISPFAELASSLRNTPTVSFRLALQKTEDGWVLCTSVLDAFPKAVRPAWSAYDYEHVAFVAGVASGEEVGRWLDPTGRTITLPGTAGSEYTIILRPIQPSASWHLLPSHTRYGPGTLLWPYTYYEFTALTQLPQTAERFLVADDAPFFPGFDEAVAKLLYDSTEREPRWSQNQLQVAVLRVAHPEGWIDHVQLSPSSITVALRGSQLDGTRLTISGGDLRIAKRPRRPSTFRCPLPSGLPDKPWVVLARGTQWLDYRYLGQQSSPFGGSRAADVVVADLDIDARIEEAIARGEGPTIEFKERITERMFKTVAAFANEDGGVILLGVRDEEGDVVGVSGDVNREKDRITQMIRDKVVPEPKIRIESGQKNGKCVLAVYVEKGAAPPYGIDPAKPQYYVRRGATTFPARQDETRRLGQVGTTPTQVSHGFRGL